jgi:hypothetical protein
MKWMSFYHKDTGVLHPQRFATTDERPGTLANNTPPDHLAIEGKHDNRTHRVDVATGTVIPLEPAPSTVQ